MNDVFEEQKQEINQWKTEAIKACHENIILKKELHEYDLSFELYSSASMRARLMYIADHQPYPKLTQPDTGKTINYLCDKLYKLEEELKKTKKK